MRRRRCRRRRIAGRLQYRRTMPLAEDRDRIFATIRRNSNRFLGRRRISSGLVGMTTSTRFQQCSRKGDIMNKKSILAITAALCALLALGACNKNTEQSNNKPEEQA